MTKSMTGYGKSSLENDKLQISIEIKSVNSKFLDANLRLPRVFSEKEIEVRNILSDKIQRGKVSLFADLQKKQDATVKKEINKELLAAYVKQLTEAAEYVNESPSSIFNIALNMPDVLASNFEEESTDEDWKLFLSVLNEAIVKFDEFRLQEGNKLENEFISNIKSIGENLSEIEKHDPERIKSLRDRIEAKINELKVEIDQNRFEQELIFYIEKLDITEEKVRLKNHLDYFLKTLETEASGKKLGFIAQEIGREINTIGSKANDSNIQQLVVRMKDELEKIKEQVLNIV